MEILKKIVVKALVTKTLKALAAMIPEDKGHQPIAQVYGRATGIKTGETNFGAYHALLGSFEAVALETGEVYASSVAILPEPANGMTVHAVKNSDGGAVDFAFEIGIKRRDDLSIGYEFTAKPLLNAAPADALASLREQVRKALPAPPAAEVEAEAAPAAPTKGKGK